MTTATIERTAVVDGDGEVDWRALLDQAMTLPGRLGNTYCRFYQYSLQNQILLWSQGVTEPCAPFSVWKGLGRIPIKGGGRAVLHPAESRAYIQDWLAGEEVTERHVRAVFTAADKILRAGRAAVVEADAQDVEEAIAS